MRITSMVEWDMFFFYVVKEHQLDYANVFAETGPQELAYEIYRLMG